MFLSGFKNKYEVLDLGHAHEKLEEAKRLHAKVYLEKGFIDKSDLDETGKISIQDDPFQLHAHYFGLYDKESDEVVLSARQIQYQAQSGYKSFPTLAKVELFDNFKYLLQDKTLKNIVEISGLAKLKGVNSIGVLLIYRAMINRTIKKRYEKWIMSVDPRLYKSLKEMLGEHLKVIGSQNALKGGDVIPCLMDSSHLLQPNKKEFSKGHGRSFLSRVISHHYYYFFVAPGLEKNVVSDIYRAWVISSAMKVRSKTLKSLWSIYAHVYDGMLNFYPYQHLLKLMMKYAEPKEHETILDLGGGTGNLSNLIDQYNSITLVDSSKNMLKTAKSKLRNKPEVTIIKQEAVSFLMQEESYKYDLILLCNVLYAVEDRINFWNQLLRVLKDDGRIVITNSDRAGNNTIIKEHNKHAKWYQLLNPKLIGVFLVDSIISRLANNGAFHFIDLQQIEKEVMAAGGKISYHERCYGGATDGVNILFTLTKTPVMASRQSPDTDEFAHLNGRKYEVKTGFFQKI